MDVRKVNHVEAIASADINEDTIFVCAADMHIEAGVQPCTITPSWGCVVTVDSTWEGVSTLDKGALIKAGGHSTISGGGTVIWEWIEGTDRDRHVRWVKSENPAFGTVILRNYPDYMTPTYEIFGEGALVCVDKKRAPAQQPTKPAATTGEPDAVASPSHYTWLGDAIIREGGPHETDMLESWDILDALFPDDPLLWNATKYLTRYGRKGADDRRIVDLRKARTYIDRRISKLERNE